uniref:Nph-I Transcription Termination Factor n=1 Tax=Florenciella sp. virus SA2 TaxID=3240092 RepID=A0AB39JF52_9VIRU
MELLKQLKSPISRKTDLLGSVKIKVEKSLTQNNNDRIILFLELLKKDILLDKKNILKPVDRCIKTEMKTKLVQLTKEELDTIKQNQKYSIENAPVVDPLSKDNMPLPVQTKPKTEPLIKNKKELIIRNTSEFENIEDLEKYKTYNSDERVFKLSLKDSYVLTDKLAFQKEIKEKLMSYLDRFGEEEDAKSSCDKVTDGAVFNPLMHQELVKQYLNSYSPYRGLLLYHGLGSGKTCTSIGIIESMKTTKSKIIIMTPASLKNNYISQLKFCGSSLFVNDGDWEYVEYPVKDEELDNFIKQVSWLTNLPLKYLKKKRGVYLQRKTPLTDKDFSKINKNELAEQINMMIKHRFDFISYNGITMKSWVTKYKRNDVNKNPFDDSVVIIDEAHNFVSRIVNKINKNQDSVSVQMYNHLLTAENCNVVMLTGTPLINYPNELGVLFNIIGGCNMVLEIKCNHKNKSMMTLKNFKNALKDFTNIDYINYVKDTNTLQIMKNPYGFVNTDDNRVVHDSLGEITTIDFKNIIIEALTKVGYKIIISAKSKDSLIKSYKKFPDKEEDFNKLFVNNNSLINKRYFQNKITGFVSYVGDKKELMPRMILPSEDEDDDIFIEEIPMNTYVMDEYSKARSLEKDMDMRKNKNKDNQTSSYKIFSRAACNFVFPRGKEFDRPMPEKNKFGKYEEADFDIEVPEDEDTPDSSISKKDKMKKYSQDIVKLLENMTLNAYKFFENVDLNEMVENNNNNPENKRLLNFNNINNLGLVSHMKIPIDEDYVIDDKNNLDLYSPKFCKILKNLFDNENNGCHLLYSNFRTLEGIGLLKIVLDYYGYSEFKLKKTNDGTEKIYQVQIDNKFYNHSCFSTENNNGENKNLFSTLSNRNLYALYTGKEDAEEKEIIRNVFNGNFEKIPVSVKNDIKKYFFNNNEDTMTNKFGEIIKLFMISSSGAEGIDLKNVKFVHIMEPYWHPVRISQVIGRAKRICSHKDLDYENQTVKAFMYLLSYDKKILEEKKELYKELIKNDRNKVLDKVLTTDETLLEIMNKKKKIMREFLTCIKESSIDCFLQL